MLQEWFKECRLGIFLHYGIYAVKGTSESWAFKTGECSYKSYMKQAEGFTASRYDPKAWAKLFREAGAGYCVLTSKHHDGVALFDTNEKEGLSVVKNTPCKKDLIAPYCEAMRDEGLKVGLYYSQLDWSHPDYTSMHWKPLAMFLDKKLAKGKRWKNFKNFHRNQLKEILSRYGKIDLLWFDGDWERTQSDWDFAEMRSFLDEFSPETVINSRIGDYGDYETPEQQIPVTPPKGFWEYCMTANDSWGYRPKDNNYKSAYEIERTLCEIASMGGILLLDFGPKEDGTLPEEAANLLRMLSDFYRKNRQEVYESAPIENDFYAGGAAKAKDGAICLYVYGRPLTGEIVCRFSGKRVTKAYIGEKTLSVSRTAGGYTIISDLPETSDDLFTVRLYLESAKEDSERAEREESAGALLTRFLAKEAALSDLENCGALKEFAEKYTAQLNEIERSEKVDKKYFAGDAFLSQDKKKITIVRTSDAPSIMVKGLTAKPRFVKENGKDVPFKTSGAMGGDKAGTLWIAPPKAQSLSLIELQFAKPVRFYSGDGTPAKPKK